VKEIINETIVSLILSNRLDKKQFDKKKIMKKKQIFTMKKNHDPNPIKQAS
jgi:hypothetical protein